MNLRCNILGMLIVVGAATMALPQDSSNQAAEQPAPNPQQEPVPAYGQDNSLPATMENPPLSGLDTPSLEPHAAPLSYLQPGATFSQSADSNAANSLGGEQSFTSVTRGFGNLTLRRLWSNYDLGIEYQGGVGYYSKHGQGVKLLQEMNLDQRIKWRRGQLALRDSFSYLPEGNFGGSSGSSASLSGGSIANTPLGVLLGGSVLGTFGLIPRISNVSVADVSESLSPKSTVTALGGYAFTHFYGSDAATGSAFIGVSEVSAQAGYNRILNRHSQIALVYAYQGFDFSVLGSAFHNHVIQGMYGHRISGRMDLLLGAGPQITESELPCTDADLLLGNPHCSISQSGTPVGSIPDSKIGVSALARLRYRFTKTSVSLTYTRSITSGSGLFAGAQSDIVRLSAERPLSRVWNAFVDIGFAHSERLQSLSTEQLSHCSVPGQPNPNNLPACPGVNANHYTDGYIGGGVHRAFGHNFHGFLSYQFAELSLDHSFCGGLPQCNRISHRQIVTLGVDWTPRPIRID
jgi:hypothetical protein